MQFIIYIMMKQLKESMYKIIWTVVILWQFQNVKRLGGNEFIHLKYFPPFSEICSHKTTKVILVKFVFQI